MPRRNIVVLGGNFALPFATKMFGYVTADINLGQGLRPRMDYKSA